MNMETLLADPAYRFLKAIPHLEYLTLAGSMSYGTNKEGSDTDIRGFYREELRDVVSLGCTGEEQVEDKATDTVIYGLRKFVKLLCACNPNIIEMLGTREEDIIFITPFARTLRENRKLFLTKRAYMTFSGYATTQLRRLENALARDSYSAREKERHIMESLKSDMLQKEDAYGPGNRFHLYMEEDELYLDADLKHFPLREFVHISQDMHTALRNFGKLTGRNAKKDEAHLYKHAMHLLRLYFTCIDILEKGDIFTYRTKEHDLLMSVRNGELSFEKIFALRDRLQADMQKAYEKCTLPEWPDMKTVNRFVLDAFLN